MTSRTIAAIFVCFIYPLGVSAQTPKMQPVSYPQWGFSALIPESSQKQTMSQKPKNGMYDAYTFNGIGYVFFVQKAPPGVVPQQAIEQVMQVLTLMAPQTGVRRWQTNNTQGSQFSGFTLTVPQNAQTTGADSWMLQLLKGEPFATSQSVAMVDNKAKDANQYVVGVGTLGPKSRLADLESATKFLTQNIKWLNPRFATLDSTKPKTGETAVAAQVAPKPKLESGQIALGGSVDTISSDGKSLTMLADEVTSFGSEVQKIKPARMKSVLLKDANSGLEPGVRIIVIGADSGKGKPLSADSVQIVSN